MPPAPRIFVSDLDGYIGAGVFASLRLAFPEASILGSSSTPLPRAAGAGGARGG
jgi:hypothetical protein